MTIRCCAHDPRPCPIVGELARDSWSRTRSKEPNSCSHDESLAVLMILASSALDSSSQVLSDELLSPVDPFPVFADVLMVVLCAFFRPVRVAEDQVQRHGRRRSKNGVIGSAVDGRVDSRADGEEHLWEEVFP